MEEKKKVDESWKETVEKEKKEAKLKPEEQEEIMEPDFGIFIMNLARQATIALGEAPDPLTQKKEQDLKVAKFIIDTLGILKDKTKGNLTKEESELLEELLYSLRLGYVRITQVVR